MPLAFSWRSGRSQVTECWQRSAECSSSAECSGGHSEIDSKQERTFIPDPNASGVQLAFSWRSGLSQVTECWQRSAECSSSAECSGGHSEIYSKQERTFIPDPNASGVQLAFRPKSGNRMLAAFGTCILLAILNVFQNVPTFCVTY
jgi:hypothetical protein